MKCLVYKKEKEQFVRLKLKETANVVKLIAVDTNGVEVPNGSILSICEEGVHFYAGVSDKLGIRTDAAGLVKWQKSK